METFTNFARTTLNTGIDSDDTSIVVLDGTYFPTSDFYIVIGNENPGEIIHITSRTGNTLTADVRGAQSTTAVSHSAGVKVVHTILAHNIVASDKVAAQGKGWVNHGSTAGTARPTGFSSIEWYGSVQPTNAQVGDTWIDTS
jgi:hypothetical protein